MAVLINKRNTLVPQSSSRIAFIPSEASKNGLIKLAERRQLLEHVYAPSSLAKIRKTSGIDPVAEAKNYSDKYNLESVMLSRMKESFCDYDVPVSHIRILDMVREGKVPQQTIESQFGECNVDELEGILLKRTVPYQEIEEQSVNNELQGKIRKQGSGIPSSRNSERTQVTGASLPAHPSLRRLEFIPSNVAVSGLPPPDITTDKTTSRAPLTVAAASSGCDSTELVRANMTGSKSALGQSIKPSPLSIRAQTSFEQTRGDPDANDNYAPSMTQDGFNDIQTGRKQLNIHNSRAGKAFSTRQRFDFDPHHVQRDYESTFLAKRANRLMSGDMMRAIYEGKGGYIFQGKKDSRNVVTAPAGSGRIEQIQQPIYHVQTADEQQGEQFPLPSISEQQDINALQYGISGKLYQQEREQIDNAKRGIPVVQSSLSQSMTQQQDLRASTSQQSNTNQKTSEEVTRHTRQPLDGFLTEVVPISRTKRKNMFIVEADDSFGLFLQLGVTGRGLRAISEPGISNKQSRSGASQELLNAASQKNAVVDPIIIAKDVAREEEDRIKRVRERKEQDVEMGQNQQQNQNQNKNGKHEGESAVGITGTEEEEQQMGKLEALNEENEDEEQLEVNADLNEEELDEPIPYYDGYTVIDYEQALQVSKDMKDVPYISKMKHVKGSGRGQKKIGPVTQMLKSGGGGSLMYRSPSYLKYTGPAMRKYLEAEAEKKAKKESFEASIPSSSKYNNPTTQQSVAQKEAQKKKEDPLNDLHPHLKCAVNQMSFKEAPTQITQQLALLSEGIVGALQHRRRKK